MSRRLSLAVRLVALLGIASGLPGCGMSYAPYGTPGYYPYASPAVPYYRRTPVYRSYPYYRPSYRPYGYRSPYDAYYGYRSPYRGRPHPDYGGYYGRPYR